jgi:hypothetical protein
MSAMRMAPATERSRGFRIPEPSYPRFAGAVLSGWTCDAGCITTTADLIFV